MNWSQVIRFLLLGVWRSELSMMMAKARIWTSFWLMILLFLDLDPLLSSSSSSSSSSSMSRWLIMDQSSGSPLLDWCVDRRWTIRGWFRLDRWSPATPGRPFLVGRLELHSRNRWENTSSILSIFCASPGNLKYVWNCKREEKEVRKKFWF